MPEQRYASLDGLRGAAALIVVLYHGLLIIPGVSDLYVKHTDPDPGTAEWWIHQTPLRLLTAGHEAVLVFFVLSGFVLTLPFLHKPPSGIRVTAYYPRRIIRLYAPVWAAVAIALCLAVFIPRNGAGSSWLQTHHNPTLSDVIHDMLLVGGTSNLDSPLWSLTWEVWFSLLMPVMFLLIRVLRADRWWVGAGVLLIGISVVSRFPAVVDVLPQAWLTAGMLQYLPVFGLGMLLAFNRDKIRVARRWGYWAAIALLLTIAPAFVPNSTYNTTQAVAYAFSLIGVAGVVGLAFGSPGARFLEGRTMQWAGKRSFSLYLTHEPIIVAAAILSGLTSWWWLVVFALLIPVILGVAELFYRGIEAPTIGVSRTVGNFILNAEKSPSTAQKVQQRGISQ